MAGPAIMATGKTEVLLFGLIDFACLGNRNSLFVVRLLLQNQIIDQTVQLKLKIKESEETNIII